jgi:predicted RNA-binding Zn-ribbon protein involved in translation (DUF1610 family)
MTRLRTADQQRRVRRLVRRACANYDSGNCLLLEDGEVPCQCPQCISNALLCRWFREAVLPGDTALYAAIMRPVGIKHCAACGQGFVPNSNRVKYCPACAKTVTRQKQRERIQKFRSKL